MKMIERHVLGGIARLNGAGLTFGLGSALAISIVGVAIAIAVAYQYAG